MKMQLLLLKGLLLLATQAHASGLRLGEPSYGGTGCPGGSASVSLAPDEQSVSILFDQYVVEAGGDRSFDRKNCNIAVPVHVPQGYSVSVFAIEYRGFTGLPSGARATLAVDYFLSSGGRSVRTSKTFRGPSTEDYIKRDQLGMEAVVWTRCGESTNLRANTSMMVASNRWGDQAMATVDSADISGGLVYHLQWKRCR